MKIYAFLIITLISLNLFSQEKHSAILKINQLKPCTGLSISNSLGLNSFLVYPLPSDGKINVQHEEKIQEIQIFDLTGKRIFIQKFNSNSVNLELSDIPNGIYIIYIKTETQTQKQKIIINHE